MIDRRAILLTLLASSSFPIAVRAATPGADAFISNLADQALRTLGNKSLSVTARDTKFRQLFLANFAVQHISRFVLGRYWRQATPAERREYVQLFTTYIIAVYVNRLTQYSGLKVKVVGTRRGPNGGVLVETRVMRPGAPKPAQVAWRLEGGPGAYKVVDVAIEGVSMAITERQDFGSVIENNGGNVNALLAALRHRIDASAQN